MIYAVSIVVAVAATFYWALCKAAARADAAAVGWYRARRPPDEELENLMEAAREDCADVVRRPTDAV